MMALKTSLLKELVDDIPERAPASPIERALRPDGLLGYPEMRAELLAKMPGLKAVRFADGPTVSAARIQRIPEHGQRVVSLGIDVAALPDRLWIEWEEEYDDGPRKTGWLVEKVGNRLRGIRFSGTARTIDAACWPITLTATPDGWVPGLERALPSGLVSYDPTLTASGLRAALVVMTAKQVVEIVPDTRRERGVPTFSLLRLVEPWRDVDRDGVPNALKRPATSGALADRLSDLAFTKQGMIALGRSWYTTSGDRVRTLQRVVMLRDVLDAAVRFDLSDGLVQSAAALADRDERNLARLRDLAALPFPLVWLEFDAGDLDLGIPHARIGLLLSAHTENDVRAEIHGALWAFRNGEEFDGLIENVPTAAFILNIDGAGEALEVVAERHLHRAVLNERLPGFVLALLCFLSQPRFVEMRDRPVRQDIDRARRKARLAPIGTIREIRLNVDVAPAHGDGKGGDATRTGTRMALHQVRSFWRVRLGNLEFVRPFWRGDPAHGVVRKRYIVVRDEAALVS
ncbi:hypothetical protein [Azospirillum soli]|uniref:hypothetical protein n=1 Tax=Azospirillum soli TaxID=1304799 RepID=UPI001AE2B47B|nr:hypothetical protein [Azospirillum soli]MBP2315450.1 hypothetical protein [Azospirillum soli]